MLSRLKAARLLGPAVMTAVALPILLGLGTWQLQRKAWKEGLIHRLVERSHAPPVDLKTALALAERTHDIEYLHVAVRGRFDHARERYLYAADEVAGPGWHVYTPLQPDAGGPPVLVNRGFVPVTLKDPAQRSAGQLSGDVEVVGLARGSEVPGTFTPKNDAKANIWFYRDIDAMLAAPPGAGTGSSGGRAAGAYPFAIDADATPANPGGWPKGGTTIVNLPNRHLEYALTWYGLALALAIIFASFAAGRLREADQNGRPGVSSQRS